METPGPPAGWYDDPSDSMRRRYWDGTSWTDHRADRYAPPGGPADVTAPTGRRRGWWKAWAIALAVLFAVGIALGGFDRSGGCVDGRDLFEPDEVGYGFMFCDDDGDGDFDRTVPR